jgi:hypothetical protein
MEYQTRNMVAMKPLRYDRVELKPGDLFVATSVDAKYLTRHDKAAYAPAFTAEEVATAPEVVDVTTMNDPEPVSVAAAPPPVESMPTGEVTTPTVRRTYTRRTPASS